MDSEYIPSISPRAHDLRLFPERFDVVRISLIWQLHNLTDLSDVKLSAYGGPDGKVICLEEWIDVHHGSMDVLQADVCSLLAAILDEHSGPF